jgi:purine operon repressor
MGRPGHEMPKEDDFSMEKIKRNERLAAMTAILTASPNQIFTLSYFCEMFDTAKSTVSEDVSLLEKTVAHFGLGRLETVTGASGGVRYRPAGVTGQRGFIEGICQRLSDPRRILPGGFLYYSDILSDPELIGGIRVEVDGYVIDGSIRNKLEEIKEVMKA